MSEHYRLAEMVYGPRCGPQMRKFGIKYSALHPKGAQVRADFVSVSSRDDWERVLQRWYFSPEFSQQSGVIDNVSPSASQSESCEDSSGGHDNG